MSADAYREFTKNYIGQMSDLVGTMKSAFAEYFYQTELFIIPKMKEVTDAFDALRERKDYEEEAPELDVIEAYANSLVIGNNLRSIYNALSGYDIYKDKSKMSLTYILTIAEKLGQMNTITLEYTTQAFCNQLRGKASKFILNMTVHAAHQLYSHKPIIFPLYLYYIEKKLTGNLPPAHKEALYRNLETLKDDAIMIDLLNITNRGDYKRELIQRYDLFPTIQQIDLSQLSHILNCSVEGEVTLETFITAVHARNAGVVLIKLDARSNLEFSISHMLEKGKKLPQSMSNGILEYYSIYKMFKNGHADQLGQAGQAEYEMEGARYKFLDGTMIVSGDKENPPNAWVIIRTIGGDKYDVLARRAVVDGVVPSCYTKRSMIQKLIRGASTRIECYNSVSNFIIPKYIVKPMGEIVDTELEAINSDMSSIRKLILLRLDKYIYDTIAKIKPKNVYEAATVIDSEKIHNILMDTLMSMSEETEVEILISWMASINSRTFKFVKIILDEFAKSKLNDKLFKEKSQDASAEFLYNLFKRIVNVAAEKTIPDGDDMYKVALRKKILLNKKL